MKARLCFILTLCILTAAAVVGVPVSGSRLIGGQEIAGAAVRCDVQAFVVDPDPAGLNVRRGPDKASPAVATLKSKDGTVMVTIKGMTGRWARIEDAEVEETGDGLFKGPGWVYAPLLATQARGKYGPNLDKPVVKVLKEPDKRSAVVTVLPVETQVNIIGCRGDWAQVRYKEFEGWLPPESQCANTLTTCG